MKHTVNLSYGDETIFGKTWSVEVDFEDMSMTAEGTVYHMEFDDKYRAQIYLTDKSTLVHVNPALNTEIVSSYKKWLKSQDPVTLIMHEMGYLNANEAHHVIGKGDVAT